LLREFYAELLRVSLGKRVLLGFSSIDELLADSIEFLLKIHNSEVKEDQAASRSPLFRE
jgi:hypothetical protein